MPISRYSKVFDPASNSHGVDTSSTSNPAPQGVRVKAKKRIRKSEKTTTRQNAKKSTSKASSSYQDQDY